MRIAKTKLPMLALITLLSSATWSVAIWLLWRPIISAVRYGWTTDQVVKNWYLGDQFSYLTITTNVADGLPAYKEPLMLSTSSIYPSGYYWLLGIIGKIFNVNAYFLWNIVGFIFTIVLLVAAGIWMTKLSGNKFAWLAAPLPILISSLQWWYDKSWLEQYGGVQAVQWAAHAILFNPGTEQFSLGISAIAMFIAILGLRTDGSISVKHFVAAGIIQGLLLNAHSYIPLLLMLTTSFLIVIFQLAVSPKIKPLLLLIFTFAIGISLSALHIPSMPLARFVMVLAGVLAPIVFIPEWRKNALTGIAAFFGCAAIFSLPLMLRIADMARQPNSYLDFRQHLYDGLDFSIPMQAIFFKGFPIFFLSFATLRYLWMNKDNNSLARPWLAMLSASLIASTLLEWNAHWGFGQESYRFFPYQMVFLTILATPWLFSKLDGSKLDIGFRVIAIGLVIATFPTTYAFYKDSSTRQFFTPHNQQTAFTTAGSSISANGSALTDVCVPRKVFRIFSGKPVADIVIGLALPKTADKLDPVLQQQKAGLLADNKSLYDAGITQFVTMNYCSGPTQEDLANRFGNPVATIPLNNPQKCALPSDATYLVYDVPQTGNTASKFKPVDPKRQLETSFNVSDAERNNLAVATCSLLSF